MPSKVLDFLTPLQVLATLEHLPSVLVLPLRVFGCVVFVYLHKNQWTKLDLCVICCIFMGYELHQKGYCCYHSPSDECMLPWMSIFSNPKCITLQLLPTLLFRGRYRMMNDWTMVVSNDLSLPLSADTATAALPTQPTAAASLPKQPTVDMAVPSPLMTTVLPLADLGLLLILLSHRL